MIELIELNKAGLEAYLQSEEFGKGEDIPITVHRAKSHMNNPRLGDDDILLILAKEEGKLLGYLGALPDHLNIPGKGVESVSWMSGLWVSEEARGKGIALKLMKTMNERWGNRTLSADYVPQTKPIYDRSGVYVDEPYKREGIRLYIKSDLQHLLAPKHQIFRKGRVLLKFFDFIFNQLLKIKLKLFRCRIGDLNFSYVDSIDDEIADFISDKQEGELFKRGKEELNWILSYPWVINASQKDHINAKYYFSSSTKSFEYYVLKVKDQNSELIGFMFFSQRDGVLKLPYFYHNGNLDKMIDSLHHHILRWNIKTFTCFHPELVKALFSRSTPCYYKKKISRFYRISNLYRELFYSGEVHMQDGDGDTCFT